VTVSYVGSRGNDLVWRTETNAAPLGSPTTGNTDSFRPFFKTFPQYRSIIEFTNDSKSWYDSVQLSYRQNMWHGLNTQYNYTLSKCTDYNSGSRDGATEQAMNPYDPSNNKGPCASDIRHNFNASGSYEIPHASLGGGPLQVGAVFSMLSGRRSRPASARSICRPEHRHPARRLSGDADFQLGSQLSLPRSQHHASVVTNISDAFGSPAAGKLGTCGRDSYRLPTFAQLDMNIIKEFKLGNSSRLQARWEIFNLTNHVNLGGS
jgi:hypothetical protein